MFIMRVPAVLPAAAISLERMALDHRADRQEPQEMRWLGCISPHHVHLAPRSRGPLRQVLVAGVESRGPLRQVLVAGVESRGPLRQVLVAGVESRGPLRQVLVA